MTRISQRNLLHANEITLSYASRRIVICIIKITNIIVILLHALVCYDWHILYLLTAFSVLSWISALRRKWQEHQYYKAMKDDMSFQISRARQRGIPLDSVHFDSQGNMRYNNSNNIVE